MLFPRGLVESSDAFLIEYKYRGRSRNIPIAYQGQRPIVQDEPFTIDANCCHRVVFVWKELFHDYNLHVIRGNTGFEQRRIFDDRVILAVAAVRQKRLERIAPMIHNAPLPLITNRADGEIRSPVDQAYTCPSASPDAFSAYVN